MAKISKAYSFCLPFLGKQESKATCTQWLLNMTEYEKEKLLKRKNNKRTDIKKTVDNNWHCI